MDPRIKKRRLEQAGGSSSRKRRSSVATGLDLSLTRGRADAPQVGLRGHPGGIPGRGGSVVAAPSGGVLGAGRAEEAVRGAARGVGEEGKLHRVHGGGAGDRGGDAQEALHTRHRLKLGKITKIRDLLRIDGRL